MAQQQVNFDPKGEPLKGLDANKQVLFPKKVYDSAKRSALLFTSNLDSSRDLGTGEIRYVKPRGEDQPFLIVKFEILEEPLGVMLGDLKPESVEKEAKAPDPLIAIKKSNKIQGYTLNPNAKFAWDHDKKKFKVSA